LNDQGQATVPPLALPPAPSPVPILINCPAAGPFLLHSGDQIIGPAGVEAEFGLDEDESTLSGVIPTESIGAKILTFTAVDMAGNQASLNCTYDVVYDFDDYYPPVDRAPTLNVVKAGRSVPLIFSLAGDQGVDIFATGYPALLPVDCDSLRFRPDPGELEGMQKVEIIGLKYLPWTGWYHAVWKTEKAWAGSCGALVIRLDDGTEHMAYFQFIPLRHGGCDRCRVPIVRLWRHWCSDCEAHR
jgi:hypothetical protein